jgi:hypothetical protein
MSFRRSLLVIGCTLLVAGPALASGRGARPARTKPKKMKVTTVVDKTVDGVVVERKLFLRSGGSKRRGKAVSLENQAKALSRGRVVSDRAAPLPASVTDGGRLVEKKGSYRERTRGDRRSAIITLVRPGARHFSGPEAKVVYSGGRARKVQRTRKVGRGRVGAARRASHSQAGLEILNYDALNGTYIQVTSPASLTAQPQSDTVHFQGELHGLLVNWDVSRQVLQGALEHGRLENQEHAVQVGGGWVTIQLRAVPTAVVALRQTDVERFLSESE